LCNKAIAHSNNLAIPFVAKLPNNNYGNLLKPELREMLKQDNQQPKMENPPCTLTGREMDQR
tara:strand:- start:5581 stop:5766 length:186 start_codon:yes stop_codon:yes gene_type:complete